MSGGWGGGWGGGKGGDNGGGGGGGAPFWDNGGNGDGNDHGGPNDCEPKTEPQDLSHKVLAPAGGASYQAGEQMTVSWQSGLRSEALRIDGPPWAGGFHPASWQWSAFLRPEAEGREDLTIMGTYSAVQSCFLAPDEHFHLRGQYSLSHSAYPRCPSPENQNFTFGYDVAWKVLDDCTNTAVNQTWTIPAALGRTEAGEGVEDAATAVYKVVVVNMTDPNPAAQRSTTGPAFTILRGTSSPASSPVSGRSGSSGTATGLLSPATSTPNSTPDNSNSDSAPPQPEQQERADQEQQGRGLSTGAKAGIGAGVGVSALFFLVTLLLLFRRRWRRRRPGRGEMARPDVELEGDGFAAEKEKAGPVLEAEAVVPGELSAVNHAEFEYAKPKPGQDDDVDGGTEGTREKEKYRGAGSDRSDPLAPRYPSRPVEMPADELTRAELPESPHR